MKRSRTPATAWPAVADLMTILAVIGLSAAAVVGSERNSEITELKTLLEERDSTILELGKRIDDLIDREIGFTPCWRGDPGQKRYLFTYDATFANGRFSVSKHRDFARGMRAVDESPDELLDLLDNHPMGELDEAALLGFGRGVSDAIGRFYPADCRLVVTINEEVTGSVIALINRTGFYPVYR